MPNRRNRPLAALNSDPRARITYAQSSQVVGPAVPEARGDRWEPAKRAGSTSWKSALMMTVVVLIGSPSQAQLHCDALAPAGVAANRAQRRRLEGAGIAADGLHRFTGRGWRSGPVMARSRCAGPSRHDVQLHENADLWRPDRHRAFKILLKIPGINRLTAACRIFREREMLSVRLPATRSSSCPGRGPQCERSPPGTRVRRSRDDRL